MTNNELSYYEFYSFVTSFFLCDFISIFLIIYLLFKSRLMPHLI